MDACFLLMNNKEGNHGNMMGRENGSASILPQAGDTLFIKPASSKVNAIDEVRFRDIIKIILPNADRRNILIWTRLILCH